MRTVSAAVQVAFTFLIFAASLSAQQASSAFGFQHTPLGNATLQTAADGTLIVSNIGASGTDGVSVALPSSLDTTRWAPTIKPLGSASSTPAGSFFQLSSMGVVGTANQVVSTLRATDSGSQIVLTANMSALATPGTAQTLLAHYYSGGNLIASETIMNPGSAQWSTIAWPSGFGMTLHIHCCPPDYPIDYETTWAPVGGAGTIIQTPTGASYVIDQLEIEPVLTPGGPAFGGYSSASITAAGIGSFNITGEALSEFPQFPSASAQNIGQIADGASWQTSFQIVNLDQAPVTYAFRFWGDDGKPLALPIVNGSTGTLSGTLAPGATAFAETAGTSASLLQGWAQVSSDGRIGVLTIFKQVVSGRPNSEGTVTGTLSGSQIYLPFDNSQGYITGVAIANTNSSQPLAISLLFELDNGTQITGSLSLSANQHMAFELPSMFPAVANARGTIKLTAASPSMAVVGLRFSPTNSFTSLGSFQ